MINLILKLKAQPYHFRPPETGRENDMDSVRTAIEELGFEVHEVNDTKLVAEALERTLTGVDQGTADALDQILGYWATEISGEFATYEIVAPDTVEVEL